MAQNWVEKYRPKTLADVLGNRTGIELLRKWAESWENGRPEKSGAVLAGNPGVGKTSTALALAKDFSWSAVELNASDARNASAIEKVALSGSITETFTESGDFISSRAGGRKLIIFDEADNLFEAKGGGGDGDEPDMGDRGGKRAIVETLANAKQPIILIVNDYYELIKGRYGSEIKKNCVEIKFDSPTKIQTSKLLRNICESEGVSASQEAIDAIADRAGGDVRGAVNDLEALCIGKKEITLADLDAAGHRDSKPSVFSAVATVLKTKDIEKAKDAIEKLDETPDSVLLWIDENILAEYKNPLDIYNAYSILARADVNLGRVRKRRSSYALWKYASELMSSGVAASKQRPYPGFNRYGFPMWLRKMSQSKGRRQQRDAIAEKIGGHCHMSRSGVKADVLINFEYIFARDQEFCTQMIGAMELDKDEFEFLVERAGAESKVKYIIPERKPVEEPHEKKEAAKDAGSAAAKEGARSKSDGKGAKKDAGAEKPKAASQSNLFDF